MKTTILALATILCCTCVMVNAANQEPSINKTETNATDTTRHHRHHHNNGFAHKSGHKHGNFKHLDAAQRVDMLSKEITDMSDEQKAKLTEVFKKQDETRKAKMEEMKSERETEMNEIKSILNDEQFEKYQKSHKPQHNANFGKQPKADTMRAHKFGGNSHQMQNGNHKFGNFQHPDAAQRVERLAKTITDLSDKQKSDLTELFKKQDETRKARMEEMKNKGQQSDNFKDGRPTEEFMAKMKAEREAELADLKKILNNEQFEKYQESQKHHQRGGFKPQF